jgi:hypothetical protein
MAVQRICRTKTLFEGTKDTPFDGWLKKIAKKPNILMLLKLENGFVVGGFSEGAFDSQYPK